MQLLIVDQPILQIPSLLDHQIALEIHLDILTGYVLKIIPLGLCGW